MKLIAIIVFCLLSQNTFTQNSETDDHLDSVENYMGELNNTLDSIMNFLGDINNLPSDTLEMLNSLSKMIKEYEFDTLTTPPLFTSILYSLRAEIHRDLEDFPSAIHDYNKAIIATPNDHYLLVSKGNVKNLVGDYYGALSDCTQAIKHNTLNQMYLYRAWSCKGIANTLLHNFKQSANDFTMAVQAGPDQLSLARAYKSRGLAKLALDDMEGCLDLSRAGELGDRKVYDLIKELCSY